MRIKRLKIHNYKSFRESDWITFGSGFNIIVGQNNSGKTALLETLRLRNCPSVPYLGLSIPKNIAPNPNSHLDIDLSVSGSDIKEMLSHFGSSILIPVQSKERNEIKDFINGLFSNENINLKLSVISGKNYTSRLYPSHGLFKGSDRTLATNVSFAPDRRNIDTQGMTGSRNDELPKLLDNRLNNYLYVFSAERHNIGTWKLEDTELLDPNARNLPAVLMKLQGNPSRFSLFNEHIREIFLNVKYVTVVPTGSQLNIRVWQIETDSKRDDLAMPLEQCGTGISQVLAILYVAMTGESNIIAIDEPNSYLHPGAAKKLINILRQYDKNQYIIATHSSEIIAISDPDTIHHLTWNGEETVIEQLDRSSIDHMTRLLKDLGTNLSDVFGADRVIWVEGPTERECFPLIYETQFGSNRNSPDGSSQSPTMVVKWASDRNFGPELSR